jgi:hypothetical protein
MRTERRGEERGERREERGEERGLYSPDTLQYLYYNIILIIYMYTV